MNRSRFLLVTFLSILALAGAGGFILFFEGDKPTVNLEETGAFIGSKGRIHYRVTDSRSGIQNITVWASQGATKKILHSEDFPRATFVGQAGPLQQAQEVVFDVKKEGFDDGPMEIGVEATDFSLRNWLRGNKTLAVKQVTVDTVPPRIEILHNEKYISPGGAGIAIYRIAGTCSEHGVNINRKFYRGFSLGDGQNDGYISYFALPFDAEHIEELGISATDQAGNTSFVPFTTVFKKAEQRRDDINVSDGFLNQKIPEFEQYYPEMQGESIDKYLFANGEVRRDNNRKISELCNTPIAERLWEGHFSRMPGSSRAGFADHRTYFYNGKAVDQQVHLGMDIASTRKAEVRAANKGQVAFTGYLGIYGNMVLVDHGQGVFSLYSHLSQITVKKGDTVGRESVLGLTGTTGMAGGDHLHFSMLVHGTFVTPKEWWDPHWVAVTIDEPVANLKF